MIKSARPVRGMPTRCTKFALQFELCAEERRKHEASYYHQELQERVNEVYDKYDGEWEPDTERGCEPSDSQIVDGLLSLPDFELLKKLKGEL